MLDEGLPLYAYHAPDATSVETNAIEKLRKYIEVGDLGVAPCSLPDDDDDTGRRPIA